MFYSTLQISEEGQFRKACRSRKKESNQSEIKQSEPAKTIFQIQKGKEFVRALFYEQCRKNSLERLYIVKGLLVLTKKASINAVLSSLLMRYFDLRITMFEKAKLHSFQTQLVGDCFYHLKQ